jgi:hypothetical protein
MKKSILILSLFFLSVFTYAQGSIRGIVVDGSNGETMPGAHVYVEIGDQTVGTATDIDGLFIIKPLSPGTYNISASFTGYGKKMRTNVVVKPDKIVFVDTIFLLPGVEFDDIVVEVERVRIIDVEEPAKMTILSADIDRLPSNDNLASIVSLIAPDVKVDDETNQLIVRGSRPGSSVFFIDGVKRESMEGAVPTGSIGSITVYTGGIPVKYGDMTGGVVVIETKGYFDLLNEWKAREANRKYASRNE